MVKETKLYDLLGVTPTADEKELKKGYRKAALKYHPDKPTGNTEKFKEISEAFEILNDPHKRDVYDQFGLEAARNGGPSFAEAGNPPPSGQGRTFSGFGGSRQTFTDQDAFNIFSQFFGGGAGNMADDGNFSFQTFTSGESPQARNTRFTTSNAGMPGMGFANKRTKMRPMGGTGFTNEFGGGMPGGFSGFTQEMPTRGGLNQSTNEESPMKVEIPVSLEDLFQGNKKSYRISRKGPHGSSEKTMVVINLKPGWKAGTKLTYPQLGDFDDSTGKRRPLQVILKEKPHPQFQRDGDDLVYRLKLSFKESLLGFSKTVPTIDGRKLPIDRVIPIKPFEEQKFPGQGMLSAKQPDKRGNLIVRYDVDYPRSLTSKQKQVIAENF